ADDAVEGGEQLGVGNRYAVVGNALGGQEFGQLQAFVRLVQAFGRHQRVVPARVAQRGHRQRCARDARLDVDDRLRLGRKLGLGGAGQRQDLLYIAVVKAQQGARVRVLACVIRGVGQARAALGEVADVAVQVGKVEVGA